MKTSFTESFGQTPFIIGGKSYNKGDTVIMLTQDGRVERDWILDDVVSGEIKITKLTEHGPDYRMISQEDFLLAQRIG